MEELGALVARAQAGDRNQFGTIVERFQDMAVGYAYSILGDFHLAQDAAQEAFLEAYLTLEKLREPAAFPGWFRKILFKQCDRLTRGKQLPLISWEGVVENTPGGTDPASIAEKREMQAEVRRAIASLPADERSATTLFYISGHSQREIAEFLGVPVTTVKNRLYTARNRLRERMIEMVGDNLQDQRPSKDAAFTERVMQMLRAASAGDSGRVQELLGQDPGLTGSHDDPQHGHHSVSALHYAAEHGHIDVAKALLDAGADINALEKSHGTSALAWAAVFPVQQKEMAEFLISRGARVDIFSAAALGRASDVESLLKGDRDLVHARLSRSDRGMQPLHVAAQKGQARVAEILMAHGADVTSKDDCGKTPLDYAEESGHGEVAGVLKRAKA